MSEDDRKLAALELAESTADTSDPLAKRLRQTLAAVAAFAPSRRGACPAREELVAYFEQLLPAEPNARLEAHAAVCPFCASDLADLAALATPPIFEAVLQLAAGGLKLLTHSFGSAATPLPAPARGPQPDAVVELAARSEALDLHVRVVAGSPNSADVRVQLRRQDLPAGRARINLMRGEDLLESRSAVGTEEVTFADVPPGSYTLAVQPAEGFEVARVNLEVRGAEEAVA